MIRIITLNQEKQPITVAECASLKEALELRMRLAARCPELFIVDDTYSTIDGQEFTREYYENLC